MHGHLAGDVDFVLDRDRHAEQRPLLAGLQPRLGLLGFEQRPLGEDLAEGVQVRVVALDPDQVHVDELGRRDLARADHLRLARGAREGDRLVDVDLGL